MPVELIGAIGLIMVLVLIFLRLPIVITLMSVSVIGIYIIRGTGALETAIETITWAHTYSYLLTTIPMFVLMGEFMFVSGTSSELFDFFRKMFGRTKGGLGIATIAASAMFAASSGSSVATTGTIGVMAHGEMKNAGYKSSFSSGTIAVGGTLGILIPPSTMLIIYGMLTEQSIGKLLIAGIIPGIMLALLLMLTVFVSAWITPDLAPPGRKVPWKEKFRSVGSIGWILVVFIVVIGGMYIGIFSPVEAAGIGATTTFLVAAIRRKLTIKSFIQVLTSTLRTTGFIFAIVIGAFLLSYFLAITKFPSYIAGALTSLDLSPVATLALIIIMYIILGAIMDTLAMLVITMPIVMPIIVSLDYDLIWFGIIVILVVEMALITPPMGMNCFVLKGVVPELKIEDIFVGVLRFVIPILVLIIILIIWPDIVMFLPNKMTG